MLIKYMELDRSLCFYCLMFVVKLMSKPKSPIFVVVTARFIDR